MPRQAETKTAADTGRCERCNEYAIIFLNGQRLLCWDHYCAEMRKHSIDPKESPDGDAARL